MLGAYANAFVADEGGRPRALRIARRACRKPTDSGELDNLVGDGVPHGPAAHQRLVRAGWEEACRDTALVTLDFALRHRLLGAATPRPPG